MIFPTIKERVKASGSFQDSNLHEYSHREWGGMLESFYLPRWEMFIQNLTKELNGEKVSPVNFYKFEEAWNRNYGTFSETPKGNPINVARNLYFKYRTDLERRGL